MAPGNLPERSSDFYGKEIRRIALCPNANNEKAFAEKINQIRNGRMAEKFYSLTYRSYEFIIRL